MMIVASIKGTVEDAIKASAIYSGEIVKVRKCDAFHTIVSLRLPSGMAQEWFGASGNDIPAAPGTLLYYIEE